MFYKRLLANLSQFYTCENLRTIAPLKNKEGVETNGITVDLHRMDKIHARALVRNIITCMPGAGHVLVIHGKGRGVLKKAVRKIKHPRVSQMIIPRNDGITCFDID